jgi:hypothetical protein
MRSDVELRVIAAYGHTGNLVLETATLQPVGAAAALSNADGGVWIALSPETLQAAVFHVKNIHAPAREHGVRWTPGLVFAVTKSAVVDIASSTKVRLRPLSSSIIAAWKRDRTTAQGILDSRQREGGCGAVSAMVADQTKTQWTARSLTTLEGVLERCCQPHFRS